MSALPKPRYAERRKFKRYAVVGSLPVDLLRADGEPLRMFVQDLSKNGLGVVLSTPVKRHECLELTWRDPSNTGFQARVVWIREVVDEDGSMFHCGLQIQDSAIDLEAMARSCETVTLDELD
jgi:c-di-GMP-binding flagellar brake protein YcgR